MQYKPSEKIEFDAPESDSLLIQWSSIQKSLSDEFSWKISISPNAGLEGGLICLLLGLRFTKNIINY